VMGVALGGRLSFNPLSDELKDSHGKAFKLEPPQKAASIPANGFQISREGYVPPPSNPDSVTVHVDPKSRRLQLLAPFAKWDGKDFVKLPLLLKTKGKCTTDHISPAGVWLRFRGHLDNISDNLFTGAINAFSGEAGKTLNQLTGANEATPKVARYYKEKPLRWVVVGDENYGEGSSREHAAMSPRHLGCAAVIVKSFARIHETNLKKQGILPLTFLQPGDYDKVAETDKISILELSALEPKKTVIAVLHHANGTEDRMTLTHSLSREQLEWFRSGSALNRMKNE